MPRKANNKQLMKTLFLTLGVLIVALIVVLILMLATGGTKDIGEQQQKQIDNGTFVQGVMVGGIDVSGMKYADAMTNAQIVAKANEVEDSFTYTFTANGKELSYSAAELGITSGLEHTLQQALFYGNVGSGADIREQRGTARESGVDFPLVPYGDEASILQALQVLKPQIDVLPQDAKLDISDDLLGEARFTYIDEVVGVDVDIAQLARLISSNLDQGDFGVIEAPVVITNPSIDVQTLKANTKLIGTYSSEFKGSTLGHPDRVTNIELLADIVNGVVIQPGEIWSINEEAGPRNSETAKTIGWAEAPGISSGRYTEQVGGGVCQISSSVYNSAILAEMDIVYRKAHSWPSSYIAKGMDATISTGGPDLQISNPYTMPVYIAVFVDKEEYKVTVEFYGPPLSHGYNIDFETVKVGTIPAGDTIYHYDSPTLPNGDPIPVDEERSWIDSREGQVWEVYKRYLDDDGNVIKREFFSKNTYKAYTGEIYANYPDPQTQPITPTTSQPAE